MAGDGVNVGKGCPNHILLLVSLLAHAFLPIVFVLHPVEPTVVLVAMHAQAGVTRGRRTNDSLMLRLVARSPRTLVRSVKFGHACN